MKFEYSKKFYKDIENLFKEDKKLLKKVFDLIESIQNSDKFRLEGIGKPEILKNNLTGYYSRRINEKHRLIYKYSHDTVQLISAFGHYSDK